MHESEDPQHTSAEVTQTRHATKPGARVTCEAAVAVVALLLSKAMVNPLFGWKVSLGVTSDPHTAASAPNWESAKKHRVC